VDGCRQSAQLGEAAPGSGRDARGTFGSGVVTHPAALERLTASAKIAAGRRVKMRPPVDLNLALGPAGYAICATYRISSAVKRSRARHRNGALSSVRDASYARALFSVNLIFRSLLLVRLSPVTRAAFPCFC
jgi:hypothetical protein